MQTPLLEKFATVPLGRWPTDIERLPEIERAVHAEVWVKRDDRSAVPYGGNKVRKLEFLLAAAQHQQVRALLTVGGIGSNHVVATAVHGRQFGLQTSAVVVPQPDLAIVRQNVEIAASAGVAWISCARRAWVPWKVWREQRGPDRAYMIPPGGSSPLGTMGFVAAALELGAQVRDGVLPEPDAIFVPLGSAGTAVGLAIGCAIAGLRSEIYAVRVVEPLYCNRLLVSLLAYRTLRLLRGAGLAPPRPRPLRLIRDQLGHGYGYPTPAAVEACRLAAGSEGLTLETTYTGKTLAALLALGRERRLPPRVLFWNTFSSTHAHPGTAAHEELPPHLLSLMTPPSLAV